MATIYNINIEPLTKEDSFTVTWKNTETETVHSFENTPDVTLDEIQWQWSQRLLSTGQKLFRFLDGDNHYFQQALEYADQKGESLEIHLNNCKETDDWPFELLAKDNSFLLSRSVHLVRYISNCKASQIIPPINRPLKLLFMASSVRDIKPLLDFEKEEEAIFAITRQLPIDMDIEDTGSPAGLRKKLEKEKYDVVHLSGHAGISDNGIPFFVMEGETGQRLIVYPEELGNEVFFKNPPRLLFLSGSRTGDVAGTPEGSFARRLVKNSNIPAVLGWGRSVRDDQSIVAGQMLYQQLSGGKTILEAVQRARYQLIKNFPDNEKPAWPHLRLYSSDVPLSTIVKINQNMCPTPMTVTHAHLRNSQVKVLAEGFVGRRRQIQASLNTLTKDGDKIGVLLLGTGGLGKSCLAGKLSERLADHTLIIVHGGLNTVSLQNALIDAFIVSQDKTGRQVLSRKINMADKLTQLCHSSFKEKKYLLILDDFECNLEGAEKGQPESMLPESAQLLKTLFTYLPSAGKMTQMIITSRFEFTLRQQDRELVTERLQKIRLISFTKAEQLKKVRGLKALLNYPHPSLAWQLLAAGKNNPLLMDWLNVLAGRMTNSEIPEILHAVKGKQEEFIQNLVLRQLLQHSRAELEHLLCRLSIFRIPVLLEGVKQVAEKAGISNWRQFLEQGIALSLIEHDQSGNKYQVTPLLREELLSGLKDISTVHEIAFEYYKEKTDIRDSVEPTLMEEWIFHGLGCGKEEEVSAIGGWLVDYLQEQLSYQEAQRIGKWILNEKKRALSTESDAFLLNSLASVVKEMGYCHQAIKYLKKARSITRNVFEETHPKVATVINNIGAVWEDLLEYDKALDEYQKALAILQKNYPEKHATVATTLGNIGKIFLYQGEYKKSRSYFEKALEMDKALYGDVLHPDLSRDLNNLGTLLREMGELEKAGDCLKQAIAIDRALYREEHPQVAATLNNLGTIWEKEGKFKKAIECFHQAMIINKNFLGELHPKMPITLTNLGTACMEAEDHLEGPKYLKQALSINKALYGDMNLYVADNLGRLGEAAIILRHPREAIDYFEQAISIHRDLHGVIRSECVAYITDLGTAWGLLKNHSKTVEYYRQALSIACEVYGEEDLRTANVLLKQGAAWKAVLENPEKAIEYYRESLSIKKEVYGTEHPDIALIFNNLGAAWYDLGLYNKATFYYDSALKILKNSYGEEHPMMTAIMLNLGLTRHAMGKPLEAVDLYRKVLTIERSSLGEMHPRVGTALESLGKIWNSLGEYEKAIAHYQEAFSILKKAYGEKHHRVAAVLNKLGGVWLRKGDNYKGIECIEQALRIYLEIYGKKHLEYAVTLTKLGGAYNFLGEHKRAADLFYQALNTSRQLYEEIHPNVAGALTNIGDSFNRLGEYRLAIDCLEQALSIANALCIRGHPRVAAILNSLGEAWSALGNHNQAIGYLKQAITILESAYGEVHSQIAETLDNIGSTYLKLEKHSTAVSYFKKAYEMYKTLHGTDHPLTQEVANRVNTCQIDR